MGRSLSKTGPKGKMFTCVGGSGQVKGYLSMLMLDEEHDAALMQFASSRRCGLLWNRLIVHIYLIGSIRGHSKS